MELTIKELEILIKEGVARLHKKTLIENRIQQINEELGMLSEKKYSDSANDFIGKEISHLMKDKGYSHERAVAASINIAKDKGYKIPSNESEAPSAGLSAKKKSDVVKKAKAGGDIGKSGKGFEKVVSAAKKSGAKDPEAVAAAAMWKNVKREGVSEIMNRANDLMSEAKAMEKIKATLKGVSEKQREYNKEHNLPLDWKGTKEGYHEFITNKKHHSRSN